MYDKSIFGIFIQWRIQLLIITKFLLPRKNFGFTIVIIKPHSDLTHERKSIKIPGWKVLSMNNNHLQQKNRVAMSRLKIVSL